MEVVFTQGVEKMPIKYDTKLTALGRRREAAINRALADTEGRISKQEWARYVGTGSTAYEEAKTHMPRGMSYVIPLTSPKEVQEARTSSEAYALARARNALRGLGKKKPTDEEAHAVIAQHHKQVQKLNLSLAQESAEMRFYVDQGKETERDFLLKQVLHKHAEMDSGRELSGTPQKPSAAEKRNRTHQYYHFLNRVQEQTGRGGE